MRFEDLIRYLRRYKEESLNSITDKLLHSIEREINSAGLSLSKRRPTLQTILKRIGCILRRLKGSAEDSRLLVECSG